MSSFSTRFKAGLSKRFIGPSDLVMVRKFSMSEWFMVRVSCICSGEGGFVYRECWSVGKVFKGFSFILRYILV